MHWYMGALLLIKAVCDSAGRWRAAAMGIAVIVGVVLFQGIIDLERQHESGKILKRQIVICAKKLYKGQKQRYHTQLMRIYG